MIKKGDRLPMGAKVLRVGVIGQKAIMLARYSVLRAGNKTATVQYMLFKFDASTTDFSYITHGDFFPAYTRRYEGDAHFDQVMERWEAEAGESK